MKGLLAAGLEVTAQKSPPDQILRLSKERRQRSYSQGWALDSRSLPSFAPGLGCM
jgi:hypothetical protein